MSRRRMSSTDSAVPADTAAPHPGPTAVVLTGGFGEVEQRAVPPAAPTPRRAGRAAPLPPVLPPVLPPARLGEVTDAAADPTTRDGSDDPPASSAPADAAQAADGAEEKAAAEVAATVIAAMRAVGKAHERHVEALRLEAARRCELLAAQAELDAELIRLRARRDAQLIRSSAHARAAEELAVEADRLRDLGETSSRFAETFESMEDVWPGS